MAQVETVKVTTASIVRSPEFQLGVADVRARRPPRYDDSFEYEWGRQFAVVAPRNLSVTKFTRRVEAIFDSVYFEGRS
jgi:hypothetical protein